MALQTPSSDAAAPLFSPELISPEVLKALPEGYTCRPIQRQDYHNGFLDVLRVLTTVGDVTEEVRLLSPLNQHLASTPIYRAISPGATASTANSPS